MNKFLKITFSLPFVLIFIAVLFLNAKLYHAPEFEVSDSDTINVDALKILRSLRDDLRNHADVDEQQVYPEGFVFMNGLYGLAWCNLLERIDQESAYFKEGHAEIGFALGRIKSETGRSTFDENLSLSYGAFYTGWSTYLSGRKLKLEPAPMRDSAEVAQFKSDCERIAAAVKERVYPASYYNGAWPADVLVCIASLALHDRIFPPQYGDVIAGWLRRVKAGLDPNGLIPHEVSAATGSPHEFARGSSQSLMLIFLNEIDNDFATAQFALYKQHFLDSRLGLTGIREYPSSEFGVGDVDSGPVLLQMGSAATIVGIQTLYVFGDRENSARLRRGIEAMSFPVEDKGKKFYFFGSVPMANAFIAWSESACGPLGADVKFYQFHLYSGVFILLLALCTWLIWKPKKKSSEQSLHIPW